VRNALKKRAKSLDAAALLSQMRGGNLMAGTKERRIDKEPLLRPWAVHHVLGVPASFGLQGRWGENKGTSELRSQERKIRSLA